MNSISRLYLVLSLFLGVVLVGCGKNPPDDNDSHVDPPEDSVVCGDGRVTGGELCDPKASGDQKCPESCTSDSTDACVTKVLEGTGCSAQCVQKTITECHSGDGCCPSSCTSKNDSDCKAKLDANIGIACSNDRQCGYSGVCRKQELDGSYQEGYCVADCSGDKQDLCPEGSKCTVLDPEASNKKSWCYKSCEQTSDCAREGYVCDQSLKVCVAEKPAVPLDVAAGARCTDDAACGSDGLCKTEDVRGRFSQGYCTAACGNGEICPSGSECKELSDGESLCLKSCATIRDCRTNYICSDSVCVPHPNTSTLKSNVAFNCTSDQDCGGVDGVCIPQQTDGTYFEGYCSASCKTAGLSCPLGSKCVNIDVGEFKGPYCMGTCQGNCRKGYQCDANENVCLTKTSTCTDNPDSCTAPETCIDSDGDGLLECVDKTGALGSPCSTNNDCVEPGASCFIYSGEGASAKGFCSFDCTQNSNTCTTGSKCVEVNDSLKVCMVDCSADPNVCSISGFVCAPNANVCTYSPVSTNTKVGSPCTDSNDCGDGGYCKMEAAGVNPGGYCTVQCNLLGQCPSGAACTGNVKVGAETFNVCEKSCTSNQDCRTGYSCESGSCTWKPTSCTTAADCTNPDEVCLDDGQGNKGCYKGNIAIGEICSYDGQCAGTSAKCMAYKGNRRICTVDCASSTSVCTGDTSCVTFGSAPTEEKYCLKNCSAGDTCSLSDMECYKLAGNVNVCWAKKVVPKATIGPACANDADCGQDGVCITSAPGGICSADCESATCPTDSTCVKIGSTNPIYRCLANCTVQADCNRTSPRHVCYALQSGGSICWYN